MKVAAASIPQRKKTSLLSLSVLLGLFYFGQQHSHAGIITAGDTFVGAGSFSVGNSVPGVNTLLVNAGSVLDSAAGLGSFTTLQIGVNTGVTGDATVTGPGSKIVTTGSGLTPHTTAGLIVGGNGPGTLNVLAGGSATVNRFDSVVGPTGSAMIKVDGAGSSITSASTFNIGITGSGSATPNATAEITGGGVVNAETSVIGSLHGSHGKLTIDGIGSQLNLVTGAITSFGRAFLAIGREQKGEVNVLAGGKITIDAAPAPNSVGITLGGGAGAVSPGGSLADGHGTLNIDGAGSEVRIRRSSPFVGVGQQGQGFLNITDGGKLIVEESGTGAMFVGQLVGSSGAVNVTGAGSELQAGRRLIIGTNATPLALTPGGTGSVNVADGATIAATRVIVGSQGTLTGGGGTIVGELVNHGNISPGNSPGIMTVLGNVTLDFDGTVTLELGGTSAGLYDQLNARDNPATPGAEGLLSLGGLVSVTLYGGFNPFAGSFFDVFTAVDINPVTPTYLLPSLAQGLYWEQSVVSIAGGFEALRLSVAGTAVPEPGGLALFAIGLLGCFAARKRASIAA